MMKLLKLHEIPTAEILYTFRESKLINSVFTLLLGAVSLYFLYLALLVRPQLNVGLFPPELDWVPYIFFWGLIIACIGAFILTFDTLRASIASSNWLMKVSQRGLYIKYRSFLNRKYTTAEDTEVVFLEKSEIQTLYKVKLRKILPGNDPETLSETYWYFLDIILNHSHTGDLAAALIAERKHPVTHYKHFPVSMPDAQTLRLEWNYYKTHTKPRIDRALEILSKFYTIEASHVIKTRPLEQIEQEEFDSRIISLIQAEEYNEAMILVKRRYSYNTTQASLYIKQILKKHHINPDSTI
jgi:hypothetical protein